MTVNELKKIQIYQMDIITESGCKVTNLPYGS